MSPTTPDPEHDLGRKNDHVVGDDHVAGDDLKKEKDVLHHEVLGDADLMNEAFHGENREHEMTPWEAVKNYPMACLWAFIFCFTIVSRPWRWPPHSQKLPLGT